MKKFLASILLVIYFTASTGFVVSSHYCMDEFNAAEIGLAQSDSCSKCGMHTSDSTGCCRSEIRVLKLQQDVQMVKTILSLFQPAFSFVHPVEHIATSFYNFLFPASYYQHPPPLISKQDIYLSNCVFRL